MIPVRSLLAVAIVLGWAVPADAEPLEFSGYLSSSTGTKLLLTDLGDGTRSGWLAIGGSFHGYTLTEFNPEYRSVSATKGAQKIQLFLKPSKTGDVAAALLEDKTIALSDDGDFFIGDFPIDPSTLTEALRNFAHAQPKGPVPLTLRWINPKPDTTPKSRMAKLRQVMENLRDLAADGWRLQFELPRN